MATIRTVNLGGADIKMNQLKTRAGTTVINSTGSFVVDQGGVKTAAGTTIINTTGTIIADQGGIYTKAGTAILTTGKSLNPDLLTGFKVPIPFAMHNFATNSTTYASIPGAANSFLYVDARIGYVPWAASALGIGVRSTHAVVAGHVTFTVMNGTTALGLKATLTSTLATDGVTNSAVGAMDSYTVAANRLRVRGVSSADYDPAAASYSGIVWLEV